MTIEDIATGLFWGCVGALIFLLAVKPLLAMWGIYL